MFVLNQLENQFTQLTAVVRTVNLSVVIRRKTYFAMCSNYKLIEKSVRSVPNRDKNCISFQTSHPCILINVKLKKFWSNNKNKILAKVYGNNPNKLFV